MNTPSKTRILFFNYEYPPLGGGAANATRYILDAYAKRDDVEVDLITSAIGKACSHTDLAPHIHLHRLPIGKDPARLNFQSHLNLIVYTLRAYFFALRLVRKHRYDLTHSFFAVPCGAISLLLKWQYKIPYIVSLRGADVPGYAARFTMLYKVLTPLIRRIWRSAAFVVTNSKGLTTLAQRSAPEQLFHTVYNGIDTERFAPIERPAAKRRFVILAASRLSRRKRVRDIVEAFALLAPRHPQAHLVIAGGEGNALQDLRAQVASLDASIQRRISFSGHYTQEEAPSIYHDADVFVMASLNEGMSNNLLEALASGLPVLMTPTGGAEELVQDGQNGYIIAFESPADIAEKLEALIALDPAERLKMGRCARETAKGMSWTSSAEQYVTLYHKALADHQKRS